MKPKHILLFVIFLLLIISCDLPAVYGAPCYGTNMSSRNKFSMGAEVNVINNRDLADDNGKASSRQYFYKLSYGLTDWFCLDGKIGVGDITYKPGNAEKTVYPTNFAGGYGFRIKVYKNEQQKIDAVCGFQHISVHPGTKMINGTTNSVILDDWQGSALVSKNFGLLTPYAGTRLTRLDIIHRISGDGRKRHKSDVDFDGVVGTDINLTKSSFINIEGRFIRESSFNFGFTHNF